MMLKYERLAPQQLSLARLFLKFFRFGWLAFGGPVAQIAMIRHELVDREQWISSDRFNRLIAVMQVLPGPEAHELCVHMGMIARGRWGGLLAGLGFMLPGFVLMLGCAWAYAAFIAGQTAFAGMLLGVQVVVLALIVRAIQRIGKHMLIDPVLIALAAISGVATLAGVPFWVLLAAAAAAYALPLRPSYGATLAAVVAVAAWYLSGAEASLASLATSTSAAPADALALFVAGLKGGLLTFGGAYTAIPYVRADTVGRGWISDGVFLDGVAIAGILPAPLVIFGTFAGYIARGWTGALAVTAGMFLPAFAFSMVFYERLEQVVQNPALHRLLDGVVAAVVGIIAATCVQLGLATLARASGNEVAVAAIFAAGLLAAWYWKSRLAAPVLLAFGGVAGALLLR